MVAEGKYLCGASLHGISVWMNNPTLFMFYLFIYLFILLFAKYCTYKMVTHQLFQFCN